MRPLPPPLPPLLLLLQQPLTGLPFSRRLSNPWSSDSRFNNISRYNKSKFQRLLKSVWPLNHISNRTIKPAVLTPLSLYNSNNQTLVREKIRIYVVLVTYLGNWV